MAVRRDELQQDPLYQRYLMALRRFGRPEEPRPSPGHAIRSCTHCGKHTVFRMDAEGTWFACTRCGSFA